MLRCPWAITEPAIAYHDEEWGVPVHDDRLLFEFLILYGARDVKRLLRDEGIVRNRLKIAATIQNAKAFLAVRKEFGTFDAYLWAFVGGKPIQNRWRRMAQLPARTTESDAMSRDLVKRGFKFVGST